ncbi:ATP-dependent nuclease [Chryseobacterium luquanense]|uniref:ATP-dependent endonuclease n=1 Tax=Chryseobacterium luquanense TaxID=2983766 RepID=A0ABT3Y4P8_9FLAO|nr:ATP-dependent endonuclease [Chryseobacterium luquanense]MCX8533130.1 ATP-dependent endonuclease [Chryseobacterium luquanense]
MKIESIYINNFRLLKDFKIDLEESLSLVLGKNNTGKTSLLTCLDKFINNSDKKKIVSEDFNLDYKKEIEKLIFETIELNEEDFNKDIHGIKLRLVISYEEGENTSNISDLMMDLDPNHNKIILGYEYYLNYDQYKEFRKEYKSFVLAERKKVKECEEKEKHKPEEERKKYIPKNFDYFFKLNVEKFFKYRWKSINYDYEHSVIDESNFNDLEQSKTKSNLSDIINFKYISAKRSVTNKENEKTLSTQTSEIYERSEKNDEDEKKIDEFKSVIEDTDEILGNVYEALFSDITEKVSLFGGVRKDESIIKVISTLQRKELLKGNTTVIYKHSNDSEFPEHYNGLGYMNLISMIFEIEILVSEFKRGKDETPADINLLFIEEPEAHTHPQMQYVFIKNITELLKDGIILKNSSGSITKKIPFQYIISTHSSHIVANCQDFNSIKYLKKESVNDIKAKNIKDLEKEYTSAGEEKNYRFLKQYLTLNRAELFFADKAIFIEGDTERILLPAMMKKLDLEVELDANELPLLSQNISVIEVGNYANIFEKLISFVGLKSLIITDLDSVKKDFIRNSDGSIKKTKKDKERKSDFSCRVSEAEKTSNPTLLFFYPSDSISFQNILQKSFEEKRFSKNSIWQEQVDGYLQIIMQTEEEGYCARSFEDNFFHLSQNKTFIKDNRSKFSGLKNLKFFYDNSKDAYFLAEKCVDSKGSFAIDILRCTNETYSNWQIPAYIKEGLLWLRKD